MTLLKPLVVAQLFLVLQLLRINKWEHPMLVGMMLDQDVDTERGMADSVKFIKLTFSPVLKGVGTGANYSHIAKDAPKFIIKVQFPALCVKFTI